MRIGTFALVVTSVSWTMVGLAQEQRVETPSAHAVRFFGNLPPGDNHTALRTIRSAPLAAPARDRLRATLPEKGELTPTPVERQKLDAVRPVLIYHGRHETFDVRVIDLPQAAMGLHGRAILLISRPALTLLSAAELQALVAHDVGHDFLWAELELTQRHRDRLARQQLELQCDGIAVLTLLALRFEPMGLIDAVEKFSRFNERLGAPANAGDYPTLRDRKLFVTTLLGSRRH